MADNVGRKPIFIAGLILYMLTVGGLLLSTSKRMLFVLMVTGGISEVARYYVAYVYAIEILPKRMASLGGLAIFILFGVTKVFICLYFMLSTSKDWRRLAYCALGLAMGSLIITVKGLKESPRFLFDRRQEGDLARAVTILKYI